MKLKTVKREFILLIIVSLVFLMIPFLLVPNLTNQDNFFQNFFFKKMLLENILLLLFLFLNYYILIPKFFYKKNYIAYIIITIIIFILIYKIPSLFIENPPIRNTRIRKVGFGRKNAEYWLWSTRALMFLCITFISFLIRQNVRYHAMKEEKQLAEIAYLRAQINPHFLFNTLNNIYALTLTKSDKAPDAVMMLSKMMRFMVSESSKEFVALKEDLNYIRNYIQLQLMRLTNKNSLLFKVEGNENDFIISPLLLINFIENAFKYGIIDDDENPIKIEISLEDNFINLFVKNKIDFELINKEDLSTEIGINNAKKRLDLVYANNYTLDILKGKEFFEVNLKIKLND